MMPVTNLDIILTVIFLGSWVLFPIGIFLSVGKLDTNSDQIEHIEHGDPYLIQLRHAV